MTHDYDRQSKYSVQCIIINEFVETYQWDCVNLSIINSYSAWATSYDKYGLDIFPVKYPINISKTDY